MARLKGLQTSQDVAASLAIDYMTTGDPHFSDHYVDRIGELTAEVTRLRPEHEKLERLRPLTDRLPLAHRVARRLTARLPE